MTCQELLDRVRAELRRDLSDKQLEVWFGTVSIGNWEGNSIELQFPNTLVRDWIRKRYGELVRATISEVVGSRVEVSMTVNPSLLEGAPGPGALPSEPLPPPPRRIVDFALNPTYAFVNFVVGPCNNLAYAASVAVAENPGKAYNPLFIHGGTGLGKTHLLQAICHKVLQGDRALSIHFTPCDVFISEFISAVQSGSLNGFRERFRRVDLLIIDDVDFLGVGSRERTQEEFFHTFNALYNTGKQIVLSSDSPPEEIPKIQSRLVSRFQWGLVAKLSTPAFETRFAIVKKKAQLKGKEFPDEVIELIAERFTENIRQLEGAVNRVVAFAGVLGKPVSLSLAQEALSELVSDPAPTVSVDEVIRAVAEEFKVRPSDLQSRKRPNSIVLPRQVCMYLCKRLTNYSLEEIGGFLGGRDHTTVLHGCSKIEKLVQTDDGFRAVVERIISSLTKAQAN